MALANYTDLQASVASWLKRSDLSALIPDFVSLAEAKIARDLRLRSQVSSATITCIPDQQSAPLPTGWLEFENVSVISNPYQSLQYVNIQHLDQRYPENSYTGIPVVYSIEGQNILFGPVPDSNYSVSCLYYKRIDPLSVTPTNWLLTNHPGIYLFSTLAEAAFYTFDNDAGMLWQTKYKAEVDSLAESDNEAQFSGSVLRVKSL